LYLVRKIWIPAIALAFLAVACSTLKQPSPRIAFYTLEYPPPRVEDLKPLSATLQVDRFSVAPMYNTNQMVYRDSAFRRESYNYHRWRSNPGDLVTYFIARDLRESGLFKAVSPRAAGIFSQYALEGSVEEYFEWETEETWKAVLTVSITLLVDTEPDASKKVLFQKTVSSSKPCRQKNPLGFAEAMSEAVAEISMETIKSIHHHLKNREG
jgi:cholesterol transport system auxiliary component